MFKKRKTTVPFWRVYSEIYSEKDKFTYTVDTY